MARNYTSINHCALSSDTLAEANDATQALFWRLLCVSDDWGRFPNNPSKLKRMMQDFNHTEDQIAEAVKHFIDHESISVYEIEGVSICEWNKWDEYQTMRWKNEAEMPNREGEFEASTNPLSDRPSKKPNKSKHNISYHNKADDDASDASKDATKAKRKTTHKTKEPKGNAAVAKWVDLMKEIRGDIYKPNGPAIGNIQNAFKHVKGDITEFEKRARNYLGSEYVKLPTPAKFYNAIENYKAGSEGTFFDEDVDF